MTSKSCIECFHTCQRHWGPYGEKSLFLKLLLSGIGVLSGKVKGKGHPIAFHEGTEERYSYTLSLISVLLGGG